MRNRMKAAGQDEKTAPPGDTILDRDYPSDLESCLDVLDVMACSSKCNAMHESSPDQGGMMPTAREKRYPFVLPENYRLLFDGLPAGLLIYEIVRDRDGNPVDYRIRDLNRRAEETLGCRREETLGKSVAEVSPLAGNPWTALYGPVARTGEPGYAELYVPTLDRYFEIHAYRPEYNLLAIVANDITGRKRAEDALAAAEERYRMLFDRMLERLYVFEIVRDRVGNPIDYRVCDLNQRAEESLHSSREALAGASIREIFGDMGDSWQQVLHTVASTGEPVHTELCMKQSHKCLEVIAYPLQHNQLALITYDTGMRKRVAEDLRISEEKFRGFVGKNFNIVFTCDTAGRFTYVSPRMEKILGYTSGELVGTQCSAYVKPRSIPAWEACVRRTLEDTPVEGFLAEIRRKDGGFMLIEFNLSPTSDRGIVVGVRAVGRDISERRLADEALRRSEERFRRIFEKSPIGIGYFSPDGRLLNINAAGLVIFGAHDREKLRELNLFELYALSDKRWSQVQQYMTLQFVMPVDFDDIRRKNLFSTTRSGISYFDILITPVRFTGKEAIKAYLVQMQDITGRIETERLRQRAYEQINMNIEQFAILGDHVRHPLQVIMGMADLVGGEKAEVIATQVKRINSIVRQLDQGWLESRKIREYLKRNE